ncbi:MAG: PH domain-containing protein [Chloroflexi bacterium]|nr:PH domain-containing protein [Chloroflexota bacterium]MBU1749537.1 PH domain-containing protein [Chloroflexota bacterium]
MGYVESLLGQNEEIVFSTRQHWLVLAAQIVSNLLLFSVLEIGGLAILGLFFVPGGQVLGPVVGVAMLLICLIPIIKIVLNFLAGDPWSVMLKKSLTDIVFLLCLLIGGGLVMFLPPVGAILLMLVGLYPGFWLFWSFLVWNNRRYLITTHRVVQIEGIFNKNTKDSSLEKINDILMAQSVMGRLLNYGDVDILTASEPKGENRIERVARPVAFKTTILDQKERLGERDHFERRADRAGEATPALVAPPDDTPSVPDLIAELAELRDKGIISPAEFEAKKAELLARL